ncbi:MAG: acetolactate decarboxylase, partial [Vulcanococcus sp.]
MSTQHASGHHLNVSVGDGLWDALHALAERTGDSVSHLVRRSLAETLDLDHHTIYQVSTSGALVQGVYQGCVRVADIKRHGDFGLGTFDGLDGEGIMLDGTCWQARSDGSVHVAPDSALAPFWATTFFAADTTTTLPSVSSWDDLTAQLDGLRRSDNLFCAIRITGTFERIHYRVACKSAHGTDLVSATSHQAEFSQSGLRGSLVGFWTPSYARTINVPGYHLHLLS